MTEAEERFRLAPGSYPFQSRFSDVAGARLHHIDEGQGPLLLMLHGNPSWSYLYRHVVLGLRDSFRCVAVDLPGFGLSAAPPGFSFRPDAHADVLARWMEENDIGDATLIAHDWGGPIGLAAMAATDGRITRLCLGNTWAWSVRGDRHFEWFSGLMGGPVGRFGSNRFKLFINVVMPTSMRRRKLTPAEMDAYRAPFDDGRTRAPLHIFPEQIIGASRFLSALEPKVAAFQGAVAFLWPENDIAFRDKELAHWTGMFPRASVRRVPKCGHFMWEDAPEDCLAGIRALLRADPG